MTKETVLKRFNELIELGKEVLKTKSSVESSDWVVVVSPDFVDAGISIKWQTQVLSFLKNIFGPGNEYYNQAFHATNRMQLYNEANKVFGALLGAFDEFNSDFFGITPIKIARSELFKDLLSQAEHHLSQGEHGVAAVIAGCVCEDHLRKLCFKHKVTVNIKATIGDLNIALYKADIFPKDTMNYVSGIGVIRNYAAHGEWEKFTSAQTKKMIVEVRDLLKTDH